MGVVIVLILDTDTDDDDCDTVTHQLVNNPRPQPTEEAEELEISPVCLSHIFCERCKSARARA